MKEVAILENRWNVLVVGNNPIELGPVFDQLRGIQNKEVLTEMAFDLSSVLQRLISFHPQHILIDDNVGDETLQLMVNRLRKGDTCQVPITVLKNSNYHAVSTTGVMNFVLKKNLTCDILYRELLNSIRFFETQQYWDKAYRKRKGQLSLILKNILN